MRYLVKFKSEFLIKVGLIGYDAATYGVLSGVDTIASPVRNGLAVQHTVVTTLLRNQLLRASGRELRPFLRHSRDQAVVNEHDRHTDKRHLRYDSDNR